MTLVGPDGDQPELSVVIVTHGAWQHTERALAALTANTERTFELIVVDNRSEDETPHRLAELPNARVIFNEDNRGFGPGANQGAELARSEHLVLLNSDAFVRPGWLEPLRKAVREPSVGAAVPRFLHPDGSLQEAGALLAQDGTVVVYGDGDDPDRPCYRFRRIVDFGGAACMLIRRGLFISLGGFDEAYAPAYYEDADFCLRLAQRGYSVVYEPRSTVTHVRYGSSTAEAAVALSERNRRLFVERWAPQLTGRPWTFSGATGQPVIAARDALATPRVLICASPDDPVAHALALTVQGDWPRARITWAAPGEADQGSAGPDSYPRPEIEIVDRDDPSWLDDRLFHYDLVALDATTEKRLRDQLERTQPQALQIPLEELDGLGDAMAPRVGRMLVTAGVAPQSKRLITSDAHGSAPEAPNQ
jgi:GT2 family glycosyltransferase